MEVLKQFRLIFGSVRYHFREVEETCGVTGSQLWVLQEIRSHVGIGVSELAEKLSIHQSTASQLVDKLSVKGLITKVRNATDQRRIGLTLTQAAETLLEDAPGPAEGVLPEALRRLTQDELMVLHFALGKLIGQLGLRDSSLAGKPLGDL